jgi:hypothetical protein
LGAEKIKSIVRSRCGLWPCQVSAVAGLAVDPDIQIASRGLVPPPRIILPKPVAKTDIPELAPVVAYKEDMFDGYGPIIMFDFVGSEVFGL